MTYKERPPNAQCLTRAKSAIVGLASPALVHSLSLVVAGSSSAISIGSDAREVPSDHKDNQEWQPSEKDASERDQKYHPKRDEGVPAVTSKQIEECDRGQ